MQLSEWLKSQGRGSKSRLMRASGLAYSTILYIERGRHTPTVPVARKIAAATGGAVTVAELLGVEDAITPAPEAAE